jgi:hypothetical protein
MYVYVGNAITALGIILVSIYIWIASEEFPADGDQLPKFTAGMAILISMFLLADSFRNRNNKEKISIDFSYASKKQYVILLLSIAFVPSIFAIGFYTSAFLLLVLGALIVGIRSFKVIALTGLISLPLMYAFFELFLNAQLPKGLLI